MHADVSFGQWLKQRRKELDLTQEELARRIGCSYIAIHKIEAGVRRPSKQLAELLADLFNVPAEEREAFVAFARGLDDQANAKPPEPLFGHQSRRSPWSPGNLPIQLTGLIGRDDILIALRDLLAQDSVRLITLTGAPGIGKTRLSLQLAADMLDTFPDGVWFVELAPLVEATRVVFTTASALGLKEAGGTPILETLKEYLKDKHILLVLDNFEHLTDAAPDVTQLLASGPGVKVLVTSRVPLRVRGEREYSVPPLSVPGPEHLEHLEHLSAPEKLTRLTQLTQYEAVRLFLERAQEVKADFEMSNDNAPAVAEICVRLDGLPLAIELAAARVKMLPPQALLRRLSHRLKVLTGGARDLSARQQTLRGAIDWSYDLLTDVERQLFRRMAIFQGGRSLEALEEVCNSESLHVEGQLRLDLFDGVRSLLDKSLLQQRDGSDGEPRFWMLETIHEYAREKLEASGEVGALQREHALYFMRLAEEAEPHLTGAKQREWLTRLEDEHDNIRAALRWAREGRQPEKVEVGLRIAGAVYRFWDVRGHFSEGREWLGGLSGLSGLSGSTEERTAQEQPGLRAYRAKALLGAGLLAWRQGDYSASRSLLEESLALGREIGDKRGIANSLRNLGTVAHEQGDDSTARSLYEESLALMREIGDKRGIAGALNNLAIVANEQGDYSTARSLHEESLALMREIGDLWGMANSLNNLGLVATEQGDYVYARSLHEESLALRRETGDKRGIATSLSNLGAATYRQEDYSTSRTLYAESLVLRREIGDRYGSAFSLAGLGEAAISLAAVSDSGGVERGVRVLGAVEALLESIGAVLERSNRLAYERAVASARSQIGEEAFERAWQVGRAMSMEEAITYALLES